MYNILSVEKENRMEMLEIVLSIVASAFSIVATVIAFKSKKEVERLRDFYEGNKHAATGDGNVQITGAGNQVNAHVK